MDRIVAKEKQTDKLRMNAQNATVFFLLIFNYFSTGRQRIAWNVLSSSAPK